MRYLIMCLLLVVFFSCRENNSISIEPVSEEYNHAFLTGQGLDSRIFVKGDVVQYYEISGFSHARPDALFTELDLFLKNHYPAQELNSVKHLDIQFYQKKLMGSHRDQVYEAARDNENRVLPDHGKNLIARIDVLRMPGIDGDMMIRTATLYHPDRDKPILRRDTIK